MYIPFNDNVSSVVDNGGGLIYVTMLDITWAQTDAQRTWMCLLFWGKSDAAVFPCLFKDGAFLACIAIRNGVIPIAFVHSHLTTPLDRLNGQR
ncbi:MAG: hypothetical protein WBQ78_02565, partial [Gammaproteobacteria bacterium]